LHFHNIFAHFIISFQSAEPFNSELVNETVFLYLNRAVPGSGFKGYYIQISVTLYAIYWISRFYQLGETWNFTRFMRDTIFRDQSAATTTSWGYEDGPWKGPGPPLLGATD